METEDVAEEKHDLYKDWIIDEDDMYDTNIKIVRGAKHGYPMIDSFVLTEIFDRKVDYNVLQVVSTGDNDAEMSYTYYYFKIEDYLQ